MLPELEIPALISDHDHLALLEVAPSAPRRLFMALFWLTRVFSQCQVVYYWHIPAALAWMLSTATVLCFCCGVTSNENNVIGWILLHHVKKTKEVLRAAALWFNKRHSFSDILHHSPFSMVLINKLITNYIVMPIKLCLIINIQIIKM